MKRTSGWRNQPNDQRLVMTVNVGSITPSATYNKGKVLIVAPVGTSSGNAVETRGNTPDGISNDRTIRRPFRTNPTPPKNIALAIISAPL